MRQQSALYNVGGCLAAVPWHFPVAPHLHYEGLQWTASRAFLPTRSGSVRTPPARAAAGEQRRSRRIQLAELCANTTPKLWGELQIWHCPPRLPVPIPFISGWMRGAFGKSGVRDPYSPYSSCVFHNRFLPAFSPPFSSCVFVSHPRLLRFGLPLSNRSPPPAPTLSDGRKTARPNESKRAVSISICDTNKCL